MIRGRREASRSGLSCRLGPIALQFFAGRLFSPLDFNLYFYKSGYMDISNAVSQLSALAQEGRLAVFRLLVRAGHDGLPAGEIAAALGTVQNTLSAQLAVLSQAGLVRSERRGRSIVYFASYETVSQLIIYLMEDCCQGRTEIREPVLTAASKSACCGT